MKNKQHIMVDLETLGSTPGCAILSIGAVEFFPDTNTLGPEFYRNVNLQSSIDAGLTVEGDTFYWWIKQSEGARDALVSLTNSTLKSALECFTGFLRYDAASLTYENKDRLIWSHGTSFDLAVLSAAYKSISLEKPWAFRNERDTRTILDLAAMKMPKIESAHHALEDAKSQARTIMQAMRRLNGQI